ncbi:hypothetical protein GGTG_00263 [Gaeumannomyces tritici R3-111a-1]|uniref:Uncharacterized protein n=1 Tax=Gaeumannomyces tritici (strain R3-111a-1) TaxID=644352 RepID=J3NG70_GAET3|nr:hypothetical protein GGTG_00263 [Gaeumannomyces tritici R3-111a-1]EJT80260.1 hypothetical protein GGTG_00263 [Gaeumannomyces tritici R3-111a-1]
MTESPVTPPARGYLPLASHRTHYTGHEASLVSKLGKLPLGDDWLDLARMVIAATGAMAYGR